jgi:hypothetical protein
MVNHSMIQLLLKNKKKGIVVAIFSSFASRS